MRDWTVTLSVAGLLAALVSAAAAAFAPITVLPLATRAGGTYNFGAVTVPTGVVGLQAIIDVTEATNPLPQITTILEGSLDGGTTWMSAGAFERIPGNKTLNRQGQPIQTVSGTFFGGPFWDDTANSNRRLRGIATLGGSMRFSLVVQPL